jgi:hypothetical protein
MNRAVSPCKTPLLTPQRPGTPLIHLFSSTLLLPAPSLPDSGPQSSAPQKKQIPSRQISSYFRFAIFIFRKSDSKYIPMFYIRFGTVVALCLCFHTAPTEAAVLYQMNFESPVQGLNQLVVAGAAPEFPSAVVFGSPLVVADGTLTGRSLLFDVIGNPLPGYDQIRLDVPSNTAPIMQLDFDFYSAMYDQASFTVMFDTPLANRVVFNPAGTLKSYTYSDATNAQTTAETDKFSYSDGVKSHATFVVNKTDGTFSIGINNGTVLTSPWTTTNNIQSIRLNFYSGLSGSTRSFAVDNLALITIPEPSTVGLLGVILVNLVRRKR